MKTRIIEMLKYFSSHTSESKQLPMFLQICEELKISETQLQKKSHHILKHIIHNYGAFDISTIDGFTHRVIRTFAFDLKLPTNFEVELDQDLLLNKAVDNLISRAGTNKALTKVLVDFAIEKADDDKSWDISYDFNKISKLLVSENDSNYLKDLKHNTLNDFNGFKTSIRKKIARITSEITTISNEVLTLIEESGLEHNDFSSSYLPKHFLKLSQNSLKVSFDTKWQENLLEGQTLYPKRVSDFVASTINDIQPTILGAFSLTKKKIYRLQFLNAIHKNITPLSVLNAIQKELEIIKTDENKLLISEFNTIISDEIKNQPTPFIYERLGEKYRHYFVDEFQDTSKLQWQNLVPLMDNALSSVKGTAMLVGDAKQAIYRWRGGEAKQFIELYNTVENPFQIEPAIFNLDTNYRSHKAIVSFNNSLFKYISEHCFSNITHESLYAEAVQKENTDAQGYVNLSFLEFENAQERDHMYCLKTLETVQKCLENGFVFKDISILVRKKKEGVAIADFLTQNNIPILSSETLLIKNSPKIQLLNNVLQLLVQPEDLKCKITVLHGIADVFEIEDKHQFFKSHLDLSLSILFRKLEKLGIKLQLEQLLQMPLYELAESLVRNLRLIDNKQSDGYIQCYLDTVIEYTEKNISDVSSFLEYFDKRKERLSIAMPEYGNAISVMTIHKAKGLEFPVVIFPYADLDIYKEIEPKEWISLSPDISEVFNHSLIDYKKDIQHYSAEGLDIYDQHQSELELDNINLLYVALTRAVKQLFVISKNDINKKGEINPRTYSGLFMKYLMQEDLWDATKFNYEFGTITRQPEPNFIIKEDIHYEFISNPKTSHNLKIIANSGYLWDTEQAEAIERGNLIHLILSKIKTIEDVDFVFGEFLIDGIIASQEHQHLRAIILNIINHPHLNDYFTNDSLIYNEKDILKADGTFLRPDRITIKDNKAVVIDYKTGKEDPKHYVQINDYAKALEEMDYTIHKKLIVYINENVKVLEVK